AGLLGQVLAQRAGKSYASLVAERVTGPLGMSDTAVVLNADQQSRFAPPHHDGIAAHTWTFDALAGAGAIRSTASDLMKLAVATLHPAASPFPKVIETVLAKHPVSGGPVPMMGLGWHYARDTITILHTGQTGGYSSAIFLAPSIDAAVVVLANGADSNIDATAEKLIQMIYGMPVKPAEFVQPITIDETQAGQVAGTYTFGGGPTITVTHEGSVVFAKLTGQDSYRIFPSSPTRFFYRITPAELEFVEPDAQGKPGKVILHQNGGHLPFVRKP
ncbi:MAG: serine hydrolase, partial [Planctomycetota bacterium]|nr:serine hydrolase [Planctomycetota bacterium]